MGCNCPFFFMRYNCCQSPQKKSTPSPAGMQRRYLGTHGRPLSKVALILTGTNASCRFAAGVSAGCGCGCGRGAA